MVSRGKGTHGRGHASNWPSDTASDEECQCQAREQTEPGYSDLTVRSTIAEVSGESRGLSGVLHECLIGLGEFRLHRVHGRPLHLLIFFGQADLGRQCGLEPVTVSLQASAD